jgi:large repetitive protein
MKITLRLTSLDGTVQLVTVEAGANFTVPDGATVELVSLEGVDDLRVEGDELVLSGSDGTIRIAGLGADFLAQTASIEGAGIDGPLPDGFLRFFGWTDMSDSGSGEYHGFDGSGGSRTFSSATDNLPPSLDSSNDPEQTPIADAPSILSWSEDTGTQGDSVTADTTLTLTGTAEAGSTVTIFDGATELGTTTADAGGNWSFITAALADGAHDFMATATNAGGTSEASATVSVTVDTSAPGITITTPVSGDDLVNAAEDGSLSVSGTSPGGYEVFVTFRDGSGATVTDSALVDGNGNWTITGDISGLDNGTITIEAYAVDQAGNQSDTASETVTLDNEGPAAPVITGYSDDTGTPGDSLTSDTTLTLTGTAEANAEVSIYDNNGATLLGTATTDGNGDWNFTTGELGQGLHLLVARATDEAGNLSDASSRLNVSIDSTAPGITITTPVSDDGLVNGTEGGALSISGTSAGGQRVYVTLTDESAATVTGMAFVNGTGEWTLTNIDISGLDEGTISVSAYAVDQAGNQSGATTASFTHDSVRPAVPTITGFSDDSGMAGDGLTNDNTLTLTGTADAGTTVEVYDGATLLGTTQADGSGDWSFTTGELADGNHFFVVAARDEAGNQSAFQDTFAVTVDTAAPGIAITTPISGDGLVNASEDGFFSVSGTAAGGQRVYVTVTDEMGASVDGVALVDGAGNWTLNGLDVSGLSNGELTVEAYAVDQAGNQSGTASETVSLDNVAPAATVITGFSDDTGTPEDSRTNDTTPTLTGTADAGTTVEILDGATLLGTADTDGAGNWSFTTDILAEGSHSLTARAVDEAGNRGASDSLNLVIDSTAPGITITTPIATDGVVNAAEDGSLSVSGTASGGQRVYVTFTDEGGAFVTGETIVIGSAWTLTGADISGLQNGTITVEAYSVDQAGNQSGMVSTPVTLSNTGPAAPVITGFSEDTGTPGDQQTADNTLTFTGTADANTTVNIYLAGQVVATGTADGLGNWTATTGTLSDGYSSFTARAVDGAGNQGGSSNTYIVIIDTVAPAAPTLDSYSNDTAPAGDGITADSNLLLSGTVPAGVWRIVIYDNGVEIGTAQPSGGTWSYQTGELADGDHSFTVASRDFAGNESGQSAALDVKIDATAPEAPVITGFSDDTGTAGDGITGDTTLTVSGTAEADATISVFNQDSFLGTTVADGNGDWSYDTGVLNQGEHSFTARAADAAGNVSAMSGSLDVTISLSVTPAPTITGFSEDSGIAGDFRTNDTTLTIQGTSAADATVEIYSGGVPIGTTTADGAGNWFFTTGELADGSYAFHARATAPDSIKSTYSNQFNVAVDATPPTVAITDPVSGDNLVGSSDASLLSVSGTATEGQSVSVTFRDSLDATVTGTAIVDGSGNWILTNANISSLQEGTITVEARASDAAGNQSALATHDFELDKTSPAAPVITGYSDDTGNPDFQTSDNTLIFTGTADAGETVNVYLGATLVATGVADGNGDWSASTGVLSDGFHYFYARAVDAAGNQSAQSGNFVVNVDTVAPDAPAITSFSNDNGAAPDDGISSYNWTYISGTAALGTSTIIIYRNGVEIGTASASGGSWTYLASANPDGTHSFTAVARDYVGNESDPSDSAEFTFDLTPPAMPVIVSMSDDTGTSGDFYTSDTTPTLTGTAEANATVTIRNGSIVLGTVVADGNGDWSYTTGELTDGIYFFTAKATDLAGRESSYSASTRVIIDATAPAAPLITGFSDDSLPTGDGFTSDTTPTLSGSAAGNSIVEIFANGVSLGAVTADGSGNWSFTTSELAEASYSFTATATDNAGNVSAESAALDITIESGPPPATATPLITSFGQDSGTAGDGITNDTTPTLYGTSSANASIEIFDGVTSLGTTTADGAGNWSFTTAALGEGDHEFTAVATAPGGYTASDPSAALELTVDSVAPGQPVITGMSEDTGSSAFDNNTSDTTPTISGTADANATVRVYRGGAFLGETTADGSGDWSYTTPLLPDGYHYLTARQYDAAGNGSAISATRIVTVDTTAPTLTITSPVAGDNLVNGSEDNYFNVSGTVAGGAQSVHVTFTDSLGATVTGTAAAGGTAWTLSGANISGLQNGEITVEAYALDWAGNQSATVTHTFELDNIGPAAPVITGFTDQTGPSATQTSDTTPTLTGTAGAGETIRVYLGASVVGTTVADGGGNWTATTSELPEGFHYLTARAVDDAGNQGAPSDIQIVWVDTTAPATPTIDSWGSDTGTVGDGITDDNTITLTGTRPVATFVNVYDNGVLLGTVPMTGTSWTFTTSALPDGDHSFTVTGVDAAANESAPSAALEITIGEPAPEPFAMMFAPDDIGGYVAEGTPDDDTFMTSDTSIASVIGGEGYDTLTFAALDTPQTLDLTLIGDEVIESVERLHADSTFSTIRLDAGDILAMSDDIAGLPGDEKTRLTVTGVEGSTVEVADTGWSFEGTQSEDGATYNIFENGTAQLYVQDTVDAAGTLPAVA